METKKQARVEKDQTIESLKREFQNQKWMRYQEKILTLKEEPYIRKIIFSYPHKVKKIYYLKLSEYVKWRRILERLTK